MPLPEVAKSTRDDTAKEEENKTIKEKSEEDGAGCKEQIGRLEDTAHNNQPIQHFNFNCMIKQLISAIILRGFVLFMVD